MARRKMMNTVRTDTLESMISHYESMGRYDAAQGLRDLAKKIFAPISEENIKEEEARRRKYLESIGIR